METKQYPETDKKTGEAQTGAGISLRQSMRLAFPFFEGLAGKLMLNKAGLLMGFMLLLGNTSFAQSHKSFFNILDYGVKADGSELATEAIEKAIADASEAGGGTVYFPAGEYLTGPIHLKSNITIHIEAGALIRFSDNFDHYLPMVPSRWEGTDVINFSPLIYAYEVENITITGRGTIDGQGKKWWDFHHKLYVKDAPRSKWQEEFARQNQDVIMPDQSGMIERGFLRPPFIQPLFSKNILIEGITIKNSPFWTVNPVYCENLNVRGVTIENPDEGPNTDGINPESCRYVHISDCHITVGDDCITIKSGRDRGGRERGMPAENYTITNCTMLSGHGGVVIGSEMSGDVRKITISNCVFDGTDRGIRLKTMRGRGGIVEEIRVSNIVMKNIKDQAFMLNMEYGATEPEPVSERTPRFRNIHISNVTAETNEALVLIGLEEMPIENVSFDNIQVIANKGFTIKNARNIRISDAQVITGSGPAITAANTSILEIEGLTSLEPHQNTPLIHLTDSENVFIHDCFQPVATDLFLQLDGATTSDISLQGNLLKKVKKIVSKTTEVKDDPEIQ